MYRPKFLIELANLFSAMLWIRGKGNVSKRRNVIFKIIRTENVYKYIHIYINDLHVRIIVFFLMFGISKNTNQQITTLS